MQKALLFLLDALQDHSFCQLSVHTALTCPEGPGAWALASSLFGQRKLLWCRNNSSGFSCSDLVPLGTKWACTCRKRKSYPQWSVSEALIAMLLVCWLWFVSLSSSSAPPSLWLWTLVMSVVCSSVVGCRCRGDGGRWSYGCLSLQLTKSISMESHFNLSPAVVRQDVSFVKSLLSLLILVGCKCTLMSSSHLLTGLPCFGYSLCLLESAGFQLAISFVQRLSWHWAMTPACFE